MRGEKSGKASLCFSVSHLSNGTVIAIYNTEAESELRCGDQLMGEVRVEPGLTSVWASPQTQIGLCLVCIITRRIQTFVSKFKGFPSLI